MVGPPSVNYTDDGFFIVKGVNMVLVFCFLLIIGIISGQIFDISRFHDGITLITSLCLAYIMVEVGLEFSIEKRKIKSYAHDR